MLLPGFPSLFRTSKPQQFDYKPIYYDEKKEEKEKRSKVVNKSNISGNSTIKFRARASRASVQTNLRILLLVILLSALAVYLITY